MAFQRATWHSGLTYVQTCENCKTRVTYMDDKLDFRPWYADGFVYCPTCRNPMRHRETYAITAPNRSVDLTNPEQQSAAAEAAPAEPVAPVEAAAPAAPAGAAAFCSGCGRAFNEGENFCPICGKKR